MQFATLVLVEFLVPFTTAFSASLSSSAVQVIFSAIKNSSGIGNCFTSVAIYMIIFSREFYIFIFLCKGWFLVDFLSLKLYFNNTS